MIRTSAAILAALSISAVGGCSVRQAATVVADGAASSVGISKRERELAKSALRAVAQGGLRYARSHQDITPRQEFFLARTLAARLFQQTPRYDDPAATDYVTRIGLTLAGASDRPEVYGGYHFALMDSPSVNAFACPAGLILLHRGVLDFARDEDELAAIIAHELAHAAAKHPLRAIQDVNSIPTLSAEALLAVARDQASLSALTRVFGAAVDSVHEALLESGYDRDFEFQADADGARMLKRAGYDPTAMLRVLERLPDADGFSATHPTTTARVERLSQTLASIERGSSLPAPVRTARFRQIVQDRVLPASQER